MNASRIFLVVLVTTLSTVSLSQAATISILDYSVAPGTLSLDVPVQIIGSELVTDMAGVIFVGGGGTMVGNPAAPPVTAVSYDGSIWGPESGFVAWVDDGAPMLTPTGEIVWPNLNLNDGVDPVLANGTLLTFTLDLTGLAPGDSVSFGLSAGISGLQETTLIDDQGVTFTPAFQDGSITIIPEPSTAVMVLLGSLGLLMARRRLWLAG